MTAPNDPFPLQRVAVALLVLGVYGAVASWIVNRAGASYRASLVREITDPLSVVAAPANRPASTPGPSPEPSRKEPPSAAPPAPLATAAVTPSPPTPSLSKAKPSSTNDSQGKAALRLVVDPIWNDPRVTKKWDIEHLTIDQEKELGETMKALILKLNLESKSEAKLVGERTSADRAYFIARQLLEKAPRKRKEITYEIIVLDSTEPNAFSTPGGFIYVTEGLLLSIGEDEPQVLQFILAHEIAHVDEQHALQCLTSKKLQDVRKKLGTAEILYRYVLPNAYFEDHEFAADRAAATSLGRLGYQRYQTLSYLRKLQRYAQDHGFGRGHQLADPRNDGITLLDNHIRAHVSATQRLEAVKEAIAAKPTTAVPKK